MSLLLLAGMPVCGLQAQNISANPKDDTSSIEQRNTRIFYENLQKKAWKNMFYTELHHLFLISVDTSHHVKMPEESHLRFLSFKGKRIRSINFISLYVFGTSVNDTTRKYSTWIEDMANKTHIYTRSSELRKLLLQKEGDEINPYLLAENEHIIRSLPFIRDVRFMILPDSQDPYFVDLVILTQDVYSLGLTCQSSNLNSTKLGIYNINLWGIGHRQSNMFVIDPLKKEQIRYVEGHYRVENIDKLFMSGELFYINYPDNKSIGFDLGRKFFTSDTKWAGGLSFSNNTQCMTDNDITLMNSRYNLFNSWLGYSLPFHKIKTDTTYHNSLVTTFSIDKIQYDYRNIVNQTDYLNAKNRTVLISGLSYTSNAYYRDNLLFGFGSSEDIPYGKLMGVQVGYSFEEMHERTYLDAYYSGGNRINNFGYINFSVETGGFFQSGNFVDGILKSKLSIASQLYTHGDRHYRHYINFAYTRGININGTEKIIINDKYGIQGLKSQTLTGTQKLCMNIESVMFSPIYVLGFRFSPFGFFDVGFIGPEQKSILSQQMYSGLGIGIRIKNEHLVFGTFQLRLAYYPLEPDRANRFSFDVANIAAANYSDFTVKKPQVITFD
ncbi:MAG: hypothetical protein Q8908_05400 [Bacteroidota bacterium]|nr:hypothetical protein [Bacteroidota bacterium]